MIARKDTALRARLDVSDNALRDVLSRELASLLIRLAEMLRP